jgi:uncharacterized DUF497 family protein
MQSGDIFEWDSDNEDHIANHGVDRYEAEDAILDPHSYGRRVGSDRFGNPRHLYIGKTNEGRILTVVADRKAKRRWRVGTAREAAFKEKRAYRKRLR